MAHLAARYWDLSERELRYFISFVCHNQQCINLFLYIQSAEFAVFPLPPPHILMMFWRLWKEQYVTNRLYMLGNLFFCPCPGVMSTESKYGCNSSPKLPQKACVFITTNNSKGNMWCVSISGNSITQKQHIYFPKFKWNKSAMNTFWRWGMGLLQRKAEIRANSKTVSHRPCSPMAEVTFCRDFPATLLQN